MARPQPTHICSHKEGSIISEVCEADAVYVVSYQDRPIKIRKFDPTKKYAGYKYVKSTYAEAGHAIRLARKLNKIYNTEDFSVSIHTATRSINISMQD